MYSFLLLLTGILSGWDNPLYIVWYSFVYCMMVILFHVVFWKMGIKWNGKLRNLWCSLKCWFVSSVSDLHLLSYLDSSTKCLDCDCFLKPSVSCQWKWHPIKFSKISFFTFTLVFCFPWHAEWKRNVWGPPTWGC